MAGIENLENEFEDLKKQYWSLMKTLSSQVNNLSNQISGLGNFQQQLEALSENVDTKLSNFSSNINSQLSELSSSLNQKVDNITDVLIPELESKIPSGGGGGGGSFDLNWTTIYDKDSPDEAINYGKTTGILFNSVFHEELPDFEPYSFMKICFATFDVDHTKVFDIRNLKTQDHIFDVVSTGTTAKRLYCVSFGLCVRDGKTCFTVWDGYDVNITASNRFTLIRMKDVTDYYIKKIEVATV